MTMKLHIFKAAWGDMQPSNLCLKVDVWLQMAGLDFERVASNLASRAPRRRVPFVRFDDGSWIDDSEVIIATLSARHGIDVDAGLSDAERGLTRAAQRMIDEHMFFMLIDSRWNDDSVWPRVRDNFLGPWPMPLRLLVGMMFRRGVRRRIRLQGFGRYSAAERHQKAEDNLRALDQILDDKRFMLGDVPRSIDAAAYGMLAAIHFADLETSLATTLRRFPRLVAHTLRMEARFGRGIAGQ
ncbi:MAG: glutathione S-transferase family protein [Sphingomonas sp.]|uniref:glutathione S-transferase family protein n=1 Tax=Sphingomonas sp. TaxID=28214 RepID=UPI0025CCA0AF|nr:glutathione S-transferase family protein [Sphingomonas sp.]MBY0282603.1 glutathione S-transferase family protein [Sphingomonas sp.]